VLRKGATGKNLEPHWTKKDKDGNVTEGGTLKLGQQRLEKIIGYGTDGGMVNFDDILTKEELSLMAKYIQNRRMCRLSTASRKPWIPGR
jgi:nitrite reductase (NO-forming)/hydroxylamine reductase